jgi:diaminopimelate epimerase
MKVKFYKYQGTGNDFILIDNRELLFNKTQKYFIQSICDRRFGVGADGLMFLQDKDGFDFEMVYFNSDGNESTMCGNGGRCIIRFAHDLGLTGSVCRFWAIDGEHRGEIIENGTVSLQMKDVEEVVCSGTDFITDTGSPHFVRFVLNADALNVYSEGKAIRFSEQYREDGINVNFVEQINDEQVYVRTYERGVEDETYSCGTGVVASVLANYMKSEAKKEAVQVKTKGGELAVKFSKSSNGFTRIFLIGPAVKVFEGELEI